MKVRTSDPDYVALAEEYLRAVGQRVQNFVWSDAGAPNPIIAVQVLQLPFYLHLYRI